MECLNELVKDSAFAEIFRKLKDRITEDGVSKELQADLNEVKEAEEVVKRNYFQQLVLYTELQDILEENNYGLCDQTYEARISDNDVYRNLARIYGAMEAKKCLNLTLDNSNTDRNKNILGLSSDNFDIHPREKKVQDQNIQQLVIPVLEKKLQKKLINLYNFWMKMNSGEKEDLLLAKANQLPASLKNEKRKAVELKKQLKKECQSYSEYVFEQSKEIQSQIEELEFNINSRKTQLLSQMNKVTTDWLDVKYTFIHKKMKLMKNHLYLETYNDNTIEALKKVRQHLDNELEKTKDELLKIRYSLASYESVGNSFKDLLNQYSQITTKIDTQKWALSELKRSK